MPKTRRTRALMGIAAVVIILIALSLLLLRCTSKDDTADKSVRDKDTAIERPEDGSNGEDSGDAAPNVVDTPANPRTSTGATDDDDDDSAPGSGSKPSGGGASGGSGTKPGSGAYTYAMYLADTKRNVVNRSDTLNAAVNDALANIANADSAGLLGMYALDEGATPGDADALLSGYPAFVESELSSTVNVYSVGSATVYFGFAVVEWQDGGVLSKHTIGVPLRLINGVWCLSTIDLNTPGLTFVQSIQI